MELANIARKEGILALEGREIGNDFLQKGISLCIDGHAPDVVKNLLAKDINQSISIVKQEGGPDPYTHSWNPLATRELSEQANESSN